jgi:iron complex outermembrane recepter protein
MDRLHGSRYAAALASISFAAVVASATAAEIEEVIVTGVRAAQQAAIEVKREAPQIVDSISAEDIGKLPDVTISDSLQRVPGVQIRRSAGEGSLVNIRGMPQVLVTMNGEQYLSAGGGDEWGQPNIGRAQPDFVDIPPTLFSGVDVIKSQTAANLDGGISGSISLKTRRPFDLDEGFTATASAEGNYGSAVEDLNTLSSALVGFNAQRWGALLAVSYSDATLENKNPRVYSNGAQKATEQNVGFDFNGDGAIGGNTDATGQPREYFYNWVATELENRNTQRERFGANASLQLQATDSLRATADVSYTDLDNIDRSVAVQLHTGWATNQLRPGSIIDGDGVLQYGIFRYPRFQTHVVSAPSESSAFNTNLELEYNAGGAFTANVRWVHGDAERTYDESRLDAGVTAGDPIPRGAAGNFSSFNPRGLPFVDATIDFRGDHPVVSFPTDVTNVENWQVNSTWGQGNQIDAGLDAISATGRLSFDWAGFNALDFGLRRGERDIEYQAYRYLAPLSPAGLCATETQRLYFFKDSGIRDFCTGATNDDQYSVLQPITFTDLSQHVRTFNDFDPMRVNGIGGGIPSIDPRAMDDVLAFQNSLYPGNQKHTHPADSYRVEETSRSAFVMGNFAGTLGVPFSGNVGVRVVDTELLITSFRTTGAQFIGNPAEWNGVPALLGVDHTVNDYRDVLPSLNVSVDVASDMKVRAAYNEAVSRQDLPDLGRGLVVFYASNGNRVPSLPPDYPLFLSGRAGNPNLEPWRSKNYNLSYEWYFNDASLVSLTLFRMNIESFLAGKTAIEPHPDPDGVVRLGGPVERVANGDGGSIKGFEVGYQQAFDFLPGWLSGFGTNMNYTYSDAQTGGVDIEGNQLPIGDNSKHQINTVLWYQKDRLQTRVAYNWRSKRFSTINTAAWGDELAVWNKEVGYLDASITFDVTPSVTVYAQGTNLTNTYEERYAQWENQLYDQNIFERRYFLGVRVRN